MRELTLDQAKTVYRQAIDSTARDSEGDDWWEKVRAELKAVISAPGIAAAATHIAWWHHDWNCVSDTARAAAGRIRQAAKQFR